jgi:hypothetical protein
LRLYAAAASRLDFLSPFSHLPIGTAHLPALDFGRSKMTMLHSPPIVYHSREMHLKRLRVLARKVRNRASAALAFIHNAIIAAKLRRIQRELMFHAGSHDEWSRSGLKWHDEHGLKDIREFPQTPLLLDDKWDS